MLTQQGAREIADKIKAKIEPRRNHDIAVFRYEGKRITQFGIRRSSKGVPHNYIPNQLFVSYKQCCDLRDCPLSLDDYVKILKEKGKIESSKQA